MSDHPKQPLIDLLKKVMANTDRVIIVPEETERLTRAGIAKPMTSKGEDETEIGTVVAVGPDYLSEYGEKIPMRYKEGDRVLMDRQAGVRFRMTKEGKFLPQHYEVRDDMIPVRIVRQDAIMLKFPADWPI